MPAQTLHGAILAAVLKPGRFTSEHLLTWTAHLLSVLFAADVIPTAGPWAKLAMVAGLELGSYGYTVSRTKLKLAAMQSGGSAALSSGMGGVLSGLLSSAARVAPMMLALLALPMLVFGTGACTTAQVKADAKAAGGAFATCATTDLGKVVTIGNLTGGLETVLAAAIAANAASLEADIVALAPTVTIAAIKCAVDAIEAVINAPVSGTSTSTAPTAAALTPDLAAKRAAIKRIRTTLDQLEKSDANADQAKP